MHSLHDLLEHAHFVQIKGTVAREFLLHRHRARLPEHKFNRGLTTVLPIGKVRGQNSFFLDQKWVESFSTILDHENKLLPNDSRHEYL